MRVFLLALLVPVCLAGNILILHPLYAGSHDLVLRLVGDKLVSRGHSVTQIRYAGTNMKYDFETNVTVRTLAINTTGFPCRYINQRGEFDFQSREVKLGPVIWNKADSPYDLPTDLYCVTQVHCRMILQDKNLLEELAAENYDLAIVDLIANECSVALARALGLPVASYWGFGYQGGEVIHTSNLNLPSIVPAFMSGFSRNMNFQQRCVNMLYTLLHYLLESWQTAAADIYIKEHFPHLGDSATLLNDMDLNLVHTNFFVDYPRLTAPNTKYVGGMHIKEADNSPLEGPLADFVSDAEDGVILFSLGYTGFSPADVPKDVINAFVAAFAKVEQKVIMRFSPGILEDVPANVLVVDWLPQHQLLGRNQTVLFISHCGMNGVMESLYHRVPLLCMPIFADQPDNAARLQERGLGLTLDRYNLNQDRVIAAIREILRDKKYKAQVDRYADMWRADDRSGFDEAIYWLELLMKFGNFDHLKINDRQLNLLQYFSVDVIAFYLLIVSLFTFLTTKLCVFRLKTFLDHQQQIGVKKNQ